MQPIVTDRWFVVSTLLMVCTATVKCLGLTKTLRVKSRLDHSMHALAARARGRVSCLEGLEPLAWGARAYNEGLGRSPQWGPGAESLVRGAKPP